MEEFMVRFEKYAGNFAKPERFFIIEALKCNPFYIDAETVVEDLQDTMFNLCRKNIDDIKYRSKMNRGEKMDNIRYWLKKERHAVHPKFVEWLDAELDENVITSIFVLVTLRLYEESQAYARQQLLLDKKYWKVWKYGQKYAIEKLFE
jgi:tRNA A37 N6-isopentenylltransferase MiaA